MTVAAERNAARRVTVALLLVAVLAGIGTTFPRDVDAAEAGRVLLSQWAHLAHAVLGVAVLIDAAVLATRALRPPASRGWVLPLLGLVSVLVAVAAGVAYVSLRQPGGALGWMTAGWLAAQTVFVVVWVRAHRALTATGRTGHVRIRADRQS
jgi:hypothetical protein